MSHKQRVFSLAGTVTIVHLSAFLSLVQYERSLVSPDGTVDEATRPKVEFVDQATSVLILPIAWLLPSIFFGRGDTTDFGLVTIVLLIAANSAFVGLMVASLARWFRDAFWFNARANTGTRNGSSASH